MAYTAFGELIAALVLAEALFWNIWSLEVIFDLILRIIIRVFLIIIWLNSSTVGACRTHSTFDYATLYYATFLSDMINIIFY